MRTRSPFLAILEEYVHCRRKAVPEGMRKWRRAAERPRATLTQCRLAISLLSSVPTDRPTPLHRRQRSAHSPYHLDLMFRSLFTRGNPAPRRGRRAKLIGPRSPEDDSARLQGVPAIGRTVAGAMLGTDPAQALLAKERREQRLG